MNTIQLIFFELIRVSVGMQEGLSCVPTPKQWKTIYGMAQKQSLVGICFAGVQAMCDSDSEDYCGMTELQFLTWMGVAASIQDRNHDVDAQCVQLQEILAGDGLKSCILKGQGVAALYGDLADMRQSGDIDAWVDAPKDEIVEWAKAHGGEKVTGDLHVDCNVFPDTDVELHFTPSVASGRRTNRRLQGWFEAQKPECFANRVRLGAGLEACAPTIKFNLVYLMHHTFRHYLYEGIGLRHVMDYYMVLRLSTPEERAAAYAEISELGMAPFAGAMMWAMNQVFGLQNDMMICSMDERRGRRLMEIVMEGGNFGHGTEKYKMSGWDKPMQRLSRYIRRNRFMLQDYPQEILWNLLNKMKI